MRSDITRHLPGLNALASCNPRTRGKDAVLIYSANYTLAPPRFGVFLLTDVAEHSNYIKHGVAFGPVSQAGRREIVEMGLEERGMARLVQVEMRTHGGTPIMTYYTIEAAHYVTCSPPLPLAFNPERPKGRCNNDGVLAVQGDRTDTVMLDAFYGRTLSLNEIRLHVEDAIPLGPEDQEKTVFERVDDALRRRNWG